MLPDAEKVDRVWAPTGLDLGAAGPEEIALSIVGQIVAVRRGGSTASLKAKISENTEAATERLGVADKVIRQYDVGKSK
jgi:xanthine dehydrogenase accessory factor